MKYKAMSVKAYYEDMESLADATVVIRRWGKVYRIVYISPLHDGANYYFIQCGDPNGDCADDLTFLARRVV